MWTLACTPDFHSKVPTHIGSSSWLLDANLWLASSAAAYLIHVPYGEKLFELRNIFMLVGVLSFMACKAPLVGPDQVARQRAESMPSAEREDYIRGFSDGALMVLNARTEHRRPVKPVLSSTDGDELDPETGLLRWDKSHAANQARARGVVDGFTWAWAHEPHSEKGLPRPEIPAADAFEPWNNGFGNLNSDEWGVALAAHGASLTWTARYSGFEPQRGWRDISPLGALKAVALKGGTLWLAGDKAAWALDLATSALRRQEPPLKGVPPAAPVSDEGVGINLKTLAEKGDVQAILALGMDREAQGEYSEAMAWYQRAAGKNVAKGMEHIAFLYALGRGVPQDDKKARSWLVRAQAAGDPDAPSLLATLDHSEQAAAH